MDPTLRITWVGFFLGAALVLLPRANRIFHNGWVILTRIARRRFLAPLAVFVFSLVLSAVPSLCGRVPIPFIHDEFANLLAADTFAHGRLTNPTPPLSEHFETIHVLMHPSYASKFPPGAGLFFALGQSLLHFPIAGGFLAFALACASCVVALKYWLPPRWAMLGGLLASTHLVTFVWSQGYLGGQVAMLGGAMLLAGCGRAMRRSPDARAGISVGLGLSILSISRPLEGLIVAILLLPFVVRSVRRRERSRHLFRRALPAMLLVLIPSAIWCGYYNFRVTGHWSHLPWSEYGRQMMSTPTFFWEQLPHQPDYHSKRLMWFHTIHERAEYDIEVSAGYTGRLREIADLTLDVWMATRPIMLLGFCLVLAMIRRSRGWDGAVLGWTLFFGLLMIHPIITPWMRAHYTGAAACGFFLGVTVLLRYAARSRLIGRPLAGGILVAGASLFAFGFSLICTSDTPNGYARTRLVSSLETQPGKQLVLVRYTSEQPSFFEWVYNDADIPNAKIIFARSLNHTADQQLIQLFPQHQLWLLTVGDKAIQISKIPPRT